MAILEEQYKSDVVPKMMEQFGFGNIMQAPKLKKIVVNIGVGDAKDNRKFVETSAKELETIAGQKAIVTRAKKSLSNFKIREGMAIGVKVTLRGQRMYYFLQKLISAALPRVRDFQGLSRKAFDGQGNYNLGLREQLLFPEINYDMMDKVRGMNITFVTSTPNREEATALLEGLGLPFVRVRSE